MPNCARTGGSNSAFTLVEVIAALAVLSLACVLVVGIYTHSVRQAAAARDASVAASVARNSMNEGFAAIAEEVENQPIPARPNLLMTWQAEVPLEGEEQTTETVHAKVVDDEGVEIVAYTMKRAIYELPEEENYEEEESGEEADEGDAGDFNYEDDGSGDQQEEAADEWVD